MPKVAVSGAAGQIGYSLIPMICQGDMFGNEKVDLRLLDLDIDVVKENMKGVLMEIEDSYFPKIEKVIFTTSPAEAFADADYAILVGAFPRKQGMERKDLMEKNVAIFKTMGEAIEGNASKQCRVLVVGNPANTNCLICQRFAPSIPRENFTCLTRLDMNRAVAKVSHVLKVNVDEVDNVIIWGNHSSTQYPDVRNAICKNKKVLEEISPDEKNYLEEDFIKEIQTRGAAIINARKASSALSAARGIVCHVHDWHMGTDRVVSMGVITDGHYGVGSGLCYSFPCRIKDGVWKVVEGLEVDEFSKTKMELTENELIEEKQLAEQIVGR